MFSSLILCISRLMKYIPITLLEYTLKLLLYEVKISGYTS